MIKWLYYLLLIYYLNTMFASIKINNENLLNKNLNFYNKIMYTLPYLFCIYIEWFIDLFIKWNSHYSNQNLYY